MRPDAAKLVWDARAAADRIAQFVGARDLEDYLADDLLRSAVERAKLPGLSAALRRLLPES